MRSISMKHFRDESAKSRAIAGERVALGQIIGEVFAIKEKEGRLPNGDVSVSKVAIGDFLATNYADEKAWPGKVAERAALVEKGAVDAQGKPLPLLPEYTPLESNAIYLPGYFIEQIEAMLPQTGEGMVFAVDVMMVPNPGQPIPFMYEVVSQIKRANTSRLRMLAQQMHEQGNLRIPLGNMFAAPITISAQPSAPGLSYDKLTGEIESPDEVEPVEDVADAAHAEDKATKAKGRKAA